ncbi:MAG: BlaI/MecI/CopY family transcriptional regulator [Lachnospiraceae bacterium]|nr:BlaI/MecI/CopY family transcriptional regulator [Lachnospiraceae bacterium]
MNYRKGLSENEWYIMQVLWERGPVSLREICDALQEKKRWTKHAVTSFLKRMLEKGAAGIDESGKVKQYYAIWNREETVKEETASILDRVYQGNLLCMVSNAVKERALSPEDIAELKSILDQAGEKRDEG